MEKRLVVAMALSILVLIMFNVFFIKPPGKNLTQDKLKEQTADVTKEAKLQNKEKEEIKEIKETKKEKKAEKQGKDIVLDTQDISVTFNTKGAVVKSWILRNYKEKEKQVDLVWKKEGDVLPYTLYIIKP